MPSQGIVQGMEQIARSIVPIVDGRTAHRDPSLLVLLYHPVVAGDGCPCGCPQLQRSDEESGGVDKGRVMGNHAE